MFFKIKSGEFGPGRSQGPWSGPPGDSDEADQAVDRMRKVKGG